MCIYIYVYTHTYTFEPRHSSHGLLDVISRKRSPEKLGPLCRSGEALREQLTTSDLQDKGLVLGKTKAGTTVVSG